MLTIEKKSLRVGRYVNTQHVTTGIENYKRERWAQNSERIGKADSMSLWYSIEELEEFLATAKESGANGVRMYFAVYSSDYKATPEYRNRQTVIFVASKAKRTEKGIESRDVYVGTEDGSTILAYNAAGMCPPFNCPPGGKGTGIADADDWGMGNTLIDSDNGVLIV